jgi:hypothetical protein
MTSDGPFYGLAKFPEGTSVHISDRAVLAEFFQTWKLHHKLECEQLPYAGQTARIREIFTYHGGDILYRLENVPGIWHQHLREEME